jgi:hypothetical protein
MKEYNLLNSATKDGLTPLQVLFISFDKVESKKNYIPLLDC